MAAASSSGHSSGRKCPQPSPINTALYTVADRRDGRAQGVADSVASAKRQHRHRQPLRGVF